MDEVNLVAILETARPRDIFGSQTAARYEFQANYSMLKLIELLEGKQDFRIVFDHFDDLMVLDSATTPSRVWLYQIKSKDPGEWSCTEICAKVSRKVPKSIVSKMYAHQTLFGQALQETSIVSNASYRIKLLDGTFSSGMHHCIICLLYTSPSPRD